MNFFEKVAQGFVWIGKELTKATTWLPKVVKLTEDVEGDAVTLLPELAAVVDDAGEVAVAAVKDSGSSIAAAEALVAAIGTAASAAGVNVAADEAVVAAFNVFISDVTTKSNFADVLTGLKKLVTDYDKLGATAKAALQQLESDAKA